MSMAKGLLPDTHRVVGLAARSYVLPEADVVLLVGARLNWLLSHGKGKTWGGKDHKAWGGRSSSRSTSRRKGRQQRAIDAPLVGDIGSCVRRCWPAWARTGRAAGRLAGSPCQGAQSRTSPRWPRRWQGPVPMNFHSALNVVRTSSRPTPTRCFVNEGANALDFTRSIVDMYKPRKRLDVGTWGVMGIGMGFAVAAAVESGQPVIAIEGDSAFGFSGMEVETICRYNLPVCVSCSTTTASTAAPTRTSAAVPTWRPRSSSRTRATT
jgi:oxalyl-CoA decarboxylase